MREYLSMSNVYADSGEGAAVHELYMDIYGGEILFLVGPHWSGKPTVKNILLGRIAIQQGSLYVEGQPVHGKRLDGKDTMSIDAKSNFCNVLSIHENLASLQRHPAWVLSKRQCLIEKTAEALAWTGISRSPSEPVASLSIVEKALLWLALARIRKTKLVIFDCVGCSYSQQELNLIGRVLKKLKDEGTAVPVIDDHPNDLAAWADRTAVLRHGTVVKVLYPGEMDEETIMLYMVGFHVQFQKPRTHIAGRELGCIVGTDGSEKYMLHEKQIIGIYDMEWKKGESLPDYLESVCRLAHLRLPVFLTWEDTIYIPESSGDCLFDSMDIGSNIALTVGYRMSGKLGILRSGLKRFLRQEFIRRFQVQKDTVQVEELTCGEKKLLSIYRFGLNRPRVMLLENPMMRISLEDQPAFQEYLRELAESGVCLIVSAKELNCLSQLCDQIFWFRNHLPYQEET